MNAPIHRFRGRAPAGEPLVWLTALGVAIGLAMVLALVAIILANGFAVFWPERVAQVVYADGAGEASLLGVVARQGERRCAEGVVGETQWFLANKDAFTPPFRFVDDRSVRATTRPGEVVRVERARDGDAIGFPVELRRAGRSAVAAGDSAFAAAVDEAVHAAAERRDRIRRLEQVEIGAISARIADIDFRRRGLGAGDPAAERLAAERAPLDAAYRELAAQARVLRKRHGEDQLVLRLADGRERAIAAGDVLDWWYPNRLDWAERSQRFLANCWGFVSGSPRESNTEGGIFPALFGTVAMTLLMSAAVVPFGVLAAIYLREYARQGPLVRGIRIAVNNLAGVPSIVFGAFGVGFFVYGVGGTIDRWLFPYKLPTPTFGTGGILWAALTLALMTIPVVIVATEEAIAAVPRGVREASLACGASKWQTIQRIVLPASVPGILTGMILAMARGAGEVAPLILVGVVKLAPGLPLDGSWPFIHLERKFMHLGFHIYDLGFQSPDSDAARPMVFATTLLLVLLVLVLNLIAIVLRARLRRRYAASAF